MNTFKRVLLLLIAGIIMMGVCGCVKKEKIDSDDIIRQLNAKYSDSFTVVSSGNELWTEEYSELICFSEDLNTDVVVWVYSNGTIIDNYPAVKYKSDVEALVLPIAEDIYGQGFCKVVNIPIHYGKSHFSENMDFSEYVSSKQSSLSIAIATSKDASSAREDVEELVLKLKENGVVTSIRVFYYDDDTFKTVMETNDATTIFSPTSNKRLSATMNADYSIGSFDWSE